MSRRWLDTTLPLVTAAQANAADAAAVEAGDSWYGLMDRAAAALAANVIDVLHAERDRHRPDAPVAGRRVVVLVGGGNNGGDGWAAAPRLARRGAAVTIVSTHPLDADLSDEATRFRADAIADPRVRVVVVTTPAEVAGRRVDRVLDGAAVVVDALLGTGATGPLREPAASLLARVAEAQAARRIGAVVACDLPSGQDADTGELADGALRDVRRVVTFGALKRGTVLAPPDRPSVGELVIGDLGTRWTTAPSWGLATLETGAPVPLAPDDDKRSRGRVLIVAGSSDMPGAAVLATGGAVRMGAGLVTACGPAAVRHAVATHEPQAMLLHRTDEDSPDPVTSALRDAIADADAVVVGPGLGHGPDARAVVEAVLRDATRVVLDADAINVFRDDPEALRPEAGLRAAGQLLVCTPHARELGRLAGCDVDDLDAIGRDDEGRDGAARRLARELHAIMLAKGPVTTVSAPDGTTVVMAGGGPELGVGGTGDLLSGMLGAALARHRPDAPTGDVAAMVAGVALVHARAARRARSAMRVPSVARIAEALEQVRGEWPRMQARHPVWPLVTVDPARHRRGHAVPNEAGWHVVARPGPRVDHETIERVRARRAARARPNGGQR